MLFDDRKSRQINQISTFQSSRLRCCIKIFIYFSFGNTTKNKVHDKYYYFFSFDEEG